MVGCKLVESKGASPDVKWRVVCLAGWLRPPPPQHAQQGTVHGMVSARGFAFSCFAHCPCVRHTAVHTRLTTYLPVSLPAVPAAPRRLPSCATSSPAASSARPLAGDWVQVVAGVQMHAYCVVGLVVGIGVAASAVQGWWLDQLQASAQSFVHRKVPGRLQGLTSLLARPTVHVCLSQ